MLQGWEQLCSDNIFIGNPVHIYRLSLLTGMQKWCAFLIDGDKTSPDEELADAAEDDADYWKDGKHQGGGVYEARGGLVHTDGPQRPANGDRCGKVAHTGGGCVFVSGQMQRKPDWMTWYSMTPLKVEADKTDGTGTYRQKKTITLVQVPAYLWRRSTPKASNPVTSTRTLAQPR